MAKIKKQTYLVLERMKNREDWEIMLTSKSEFDSIGHAMDVLTTAINADPVYYSDFEFKIAAMNEQLITVQLNTTHEVVVTKE
jgi:hypothetical protein